MKNHSSAPVWLFAAAGAAGAWIHRAHVATCYDESGYIISGQLLTTVLITLSLALAVLAVLYGIVYALQHTAVCSADKALAPRQPLTILAPCVLASASLLIFAALCFIHASAHPQAERIASVLAVLGGIGMLIFDLSLCRKKTTKAHSMSAAAAGIFYCLWMVLHFIDNTKNPVLLSFCLECVALGCTCMFLFALGAAAAGTAQNFTTVCFGLLSVSFSLIALTGQQIGTCDYFVFAASLLWVIPHLCLYIRKVPSKQK